MTKVEAYNYTFTADGASPELGESLSIVHGAGFAPRALQVLGNLGGGTLTTEISSGEGAGVWTTTASWALGAHQVTINGRRTRFRLSGATAPNVTVRIH